MNDEDEKNIKDMEEKKRLIENSKEYKKEEEAITEKLLIDREKIILPKTGKLISDFASQIGEHFKDKKAVFFRLADKSVVILRMSKLDSNSDVKVLSFEKLSPKQCITFLERFMEPGIHIRIENKETKESRLVFQPKSCSSEIASIVLDSSQLQQKLPLINTIYSFPMPVLKDGKLLFPKSGYDEELLSWLPEDAPKIDTAMTLEEAKQIIENILEEFCFETDQDKTNSIAAMLTPLLRGLYPRIICRTPIIFIIANRERCGKDYLAGVIGIIYTGVATEETPLSDGKTVHESEFRKKILAKFKAGINRIHISNNKGHLNSAQLESLATAEEFSERELGHNTTPSFPNTLEISLSANMGITYTADLSSRSLFIRLFLDIENPNARVFKRKNLHEYIRLNRGIILSALYALVKNWYDKGMSKGTVPFASFSDWADICGGIMEAAGYNSPCVSNDDSASIGGDTETRDMKKLFEICYSKWPEKFIYKKEIMDLFSPSHKEDDILPDPEVSELFSWIDWDKKGSRSKFGKMVDKFVGRILSEIKLVRIDNEHTERRTYKWTKEFDKTQENGGDGGNGGDKQAELEEQAEEHISLEPTVAPQQPQQPQINILDIQLMYKDNPKISIQKLKDFGASRNLIETALNEGIIPEEITLQWKQRGDIIEHKSGKYFLNE